MSNFNVKLFLRIICIIEIIGCTLAYLTCDYAAMIMNGMFAIIMATLNLDRVGD